MPDLFDTLTLRGVTLRNRIGVSPMCQYWSDDGKASDWHLVHLGSFAIGGAALIIAEATAVEPRGRISARDAGLWNDQQIGPLRRTTNFMKQYGAVPGIQLAHAGRKASTAPPYTPGTTRENRRQILPADGGWTPLGPSAIPFYAGDPAPQALTLAEIKSIQTLFVDSAARALEAGYQWLEMHGAHGYLAHSFLSPLSNQRTDAYGGSLENRMRFTLETASLLRRAWPEHLPMSVRISATDWVDGGWSIEDSVALGRKLKDLGIDIISYSSGALVEYAKIPVKPGFQVPLAEKVRRDAGIATMAVGLITQPRQAQDIIAHGQADVVQLAREMMRDPHWAYRAAVALNQRAAVKLPQSYDYAI